ncbi:MAG: 1-deoxy-D-xylulose-5-phosphate reductoisomerase [bacterium]|nr:1-deoxy-D-xylulose-5-phosphate reductoisomerase [bacterium]
MKSVLIQGATGSIGTAALSVLAEQRDRAVVVGLAAAHKESELLALAGTWTPASLALRTPARSGEFMDAARRSGAQDMYIGEDAFEAQAQRAEYDLLLNAVTGSAGVKPTLAALARGKNVALANKETLVAAGELVMNCATANNAQVIPIDSEHSALFQCLIGEQISDVRRLWLTASGGPFWNWSREQLRGVSPDQALAHPTWAMGPKNTIDSATLFNKGLEVIEAVRLFGLPVDRIRVVRQRQSVVHSLVEFVDGSYKAQLSVPDMRLPILYAISYPERWPSTLVEGEPSGYGGLHFDEISVRDYPCLALAFLAIERGGTIPAALRLRMRSQ